MAYEYSVFVSYKRLEGWNRWIGDIFMQTLRSHLEEALVVYPQFRKEKHLFLDVKEIQDWNPWPPQLAKKLSRSRVMLSLCTNQYFYGEWCMHELAHMQQRQKITKKESLVYPLFITDGRQDAPIDFHRIHFSGITPTIWTSEEFCNPHISSDPGVCMAKLHKACDILVMEKLVPMLLSSPDWSAEWENKLCKQTLHLFNRRLKDKLNGPGINQIPRN